MPSMFGKDSKKKELIKNLASVYADIEREHGVPAGDFPDLAEMQEKLLHHDFLKFHLLKKPLLDAVDKMLAEDIAKMMAMIPQVSFLPFMNCLDGFPNIRNNSTRKKILQSREVPLTMSMNHRLALVVVKVSTLDRMNQTTFGLSTRTRKSTTKYSIRSLLLTAKYLVHPPSPSLSSLICPIWFSEKYGSYLIWTMMECWIRKSLLWLCT